MSLDLDALPRFRNPPVDEVALGVQFALPGFLPTHYGIFHERVRDEFPTVQVLPSLPPYHEFFSSPSDQAHPEIQFQFFGAGGPPLPRVLFVSQDDCSLIQVQSDRLYFNWRKRTPAAYPHYRHVRSAFSKLFAKFESFVFDQGLGQITATQCDVLYVNPLLPSNTGVMPSSPERVFRSWNAKLGDEWQSPLEDLSFNARYRLLDANRQPFGRLTATLSSANEQMRLELSARGRPAGSNLTDLLAFHDVGHESIVRCFAAITTPEMHELWGRLGHE